MDYRTEITITLYKSNILPYLDVGSPCFKGGGEERKVHINGIEVIQNRCLGWHTGEDYGQVLSRLTLRINY